MVCGRGYHKQEVYSPMTATRPYSLMVVDDERAILNLLGRLLEARGHEVQLCHA